MNKSMMSYRKLFLMSILSFISMYVLMYMMVDKFDNVYPNLNQLYMAGMMTAPMIIIELLLMWSMYHSNIIKITILTISVLLLFVFITFIREQTAISDKEFLKSMIPHHGAAILMCKQASLTDPEIQNLCKNIISSQQSEIDWMKTKMQKTAAP